MTKLKGSSVAFSSKEVGCVGFVDFITIKPNIREILQLLKNFFSPHFVLQTFLKPNDLQYYGFKSHITFEKY